MLLHQDLNKYREISSTEERIARRYVSFELVDMWFDDTSIEGNVFVSGKKLPKGKYYDYRSNCESFNRPLYYSKDPTILVRKPKEREELARKVVEAFLKAKYDDPKILELKVKGVDVKFSGGRNILNRFSLNLTADVILEELLKNAK
jgi:hypothetical protein